MLFSMQHSCKLAFTVLTLWCRVVYAQAPAARLNSAQPQSSKTNVTSQLSQPESPGPPIYVEATFGNERFDLQTFISKQFTNRTRGGFLSITSAQGQYNNESNAFEFVNLSQLNYDLYKGVSPHTWRSTQRAIGSKRPGGGPIPLYAKGFAPCARAFSLPDQYP